MFIYVLLHYKTMLKLNRTISIVWIIQKLLKQYNSQNAQQFEGLITLEPCLILELFNNSKKKRQQF